ncbi:hypothetical protein PO909_031722 [Leuciscus waleckii]
MAAELPAEVTVGDRVGFIRIYRNLNATTWNENIRKTYRDNQLEENEDVLFGVYTPVFPPIEKNPQCFLFRPKRDPIWWMTIIRKQNKKLTVQWTHRRATGPARDVINVSGKWEHLEIFCRKFPIHLQEINDNPAGNNPVDDHIEDLTARIQDLQLENRRLRQQLQN